MLLARRSAALHLAKASYAPSRALAGPAKVHDCDIDVLKGPSSVARTTAKLDAGVLYPPGVPSPMESTSSIEPIVVDGLVAKTGGDPLGSPLHYIKLCPRDTTPTACKYTGLRFVSKQALEHAAAKQ
uniref:Zinc finger CHCC-type domain-containing protein n=1 Tax=Calcidiscus leptoporus TaxID=127549 RepID=A0A7S0IND8_9EUKA|mmetsp:Transcript_14268/g.32564  ORF Transcript_14268/g.32564 Transcript_14268/m.32564 type:complete len:127 (+) Transcript_14268:22-402(+)|eukprot:CAMPEP_0119374446 /NCGR_PEP_ID=MMETSP1334-20130426/30608_1 /TAXON_ID=127549 /ORGANISM="Calcidiscus leptoporus, Strain RCC1130" /LENGTH=126 /DNA_ID=CAMNT_0007392519 /DNA_START=23 /DNA_END=403 /DNA_ORIENTATION=+